MRAAAAGAVVDLAVVIDRVIACGLQRQFGKLVIGAFCFLKTNNIRLRRLKPREQTILPFPEGIDIPGNDAHDKFNDE